MTKPTAPNPSLVMNILVFAMSFSMFIYGMVLYILQKITHVSPGITTDFERYSLMAAFLLLGSRLLFRLKVKPDMEAAKKMPFTIVCLALNEFVALISFMAVFLAESGNGFAFVANAGLAVLFNVLMLPTINAKPRSH